MIPPIVPSATFRDPDGVCIVRGDRVFRIVYSDVSSRVRALIQSPFIQQLIQERKIVGTRIMDQTEARTIIQEMGHRPNEQDVLVLEHERIPFISYPYEWCPEALYRAGQLIIELQLRALSHGFTMKDATPSNVLFENCEPVFVDILSFVPYAKSMRIWTAYAQFVRMFILPLLRHRHGIAWPHKAFIEYSDGLEPEDLYGQLSWTARFSPLVFKYSSLPSWLGHLQAAGNPPPAHAISGDDERGMAIIRMVVESLGKGLTHSMSRRRSTAWSSYQDTSTYTRGASAEKESFVLRALESLGARLVLDVGCNTGNYSCLAASTGARVVAIDNDPGVVEALYSTSKERKLSVLPMVMSFCRPSPALGWRNKETESFLSRAHGAFDVALFLAVIHHLSITDGVPLPLIFQLVHELVRNGAVVEFVPPADPMFRRMIRNKEHLEAKLTREAFETAFEPYFVVQEHLEIPESGRVMYCLKKR